MHAHVDRRDVPNVPVTVVILSARRNLAQVLRRRRRERGNGQERGGCTDHKSNNAHTGDFALNDLLDLECRPMTGAERLDAFNLYVARIHDEAALGAALALFAEREDLGMVWLALEDSVAVAACTVSYEIGLREGAIVARIADVAVASSHDADRNDVARKLLSSLRDNLASRGIGLVDTSGSFGHSK